MSGPVRSRSVLRLTCRGLHKAGVRVWDGLSHSDDHPMIMRPVLRWWSGGPTGQGLGFRAEISRS